MIPESETDRTWSALQAALEAERRVQDEMDQILRDSADRGQAERRILEDSAPKMDAALARSREALRAFKRAVEKR